MILPFYYQSQKQDFRSLVSYLKINLRDGDRIIAGIESYIPGLLHYFGVFPKERLYFLDTREVSEKELEYSVSLIFGDKRFTISHSKTRWVQHMADGKRLWILVDKRTAKEFKNIPIFVPKGYFDGTFLNFDRFPTDASFYLFLWDPASPKEKGIDIAIE
jgi:hypothetical protein